MEGIEKSFIRRIKATQDIINAISEKIDNNIDHARTRVDIYLSEEDDKILIMNDGVPMEHVNDYVDTYQAHIEQSRSNPNLIGHFGEGDKDAFIRLGNTKQGSTQSIITKTALDKGVTIVERASINMKASRTSHCFKEHHQERVANDNTIPYNEGTANELVGIDPEVWWKVHTKDEETGSLVRDFGRIKKYISKHYAYKVFNTNIDIFFNGEKLEFEDPCHLMELGYDNKETKDGVYIKNGICFWVQTYKCKDSEGNKVKFRVVYNYIPRMTVKDLQTERGYNMDTGYYTYYGDRLMDAGGNPAKFFQRIGSNWNTGGCNRVRIAIFCDDKNIDFFGITADKAEGIKSFYDNPNFSNYSIGKYSIYTIMRSDAVSFFKLNVFDRQGKMPKPIDIKKMKEYCKTLSLTNKIAKAKYLLGEDEVKPTEQVPQQTTTPPADLGQLLNEEPADNLTELIDSCTLLTEREKSILYTVARCIKTKKNFEETFNNILNTINEYNATNSNIQTEGLIDAA